MTNDSFVFYRSFAEAVSEMEPEDQLSTLWAIIRYALDDAEPTLPRPFPRAVFAMSRPVLDTNRERRGNSKAGGRPKKSQRFPDSETIGSEPKNQRFPNSETIGFETAKPNVDVDVDVDGDGDVNADVDVDADADENENVYGDLSGDGEPSRPRAQKKKNQNNSDLAVQWAENVTMTNEEHEKLLSAHGPADTARLIEILDNYKGSTGKKYKSDYRAILSWCESRLQEEKNKSAPQKRSTGFETAAEYEARGGFVLGESELESIRNLESLRDSFANM